VVARLVPLHAVHDGGEDLVGLVLQAPIVLRDCLHVFNSKEACQP
jgi:hypothetical protein